jgi:hypothetical protein
VATKTQAIVASSTLIRQSVEMLLAVMQYAHWIRKISAVTLHGIHIVSNSRWDLPNALAGRIAETSVLEIAAFHTN